MRRLRSSQRAFSLVELAVVLAILGLLLGTAMYTLSAQMRQRAFDETRRTLEMAREALLGYAVANGRLPCPASNAALATGVESDAPAASGTCTHYNNGFLPAITLGFPNVDTAGFALDAWGNRIRYAVAGAQNPLSCTSGPVVPHFTAKANLKQNGMSCLPNTSDLVVCRSTVPGPVPGNCGANNSVTNLGTVVAIVFSTGPNFSATPAGAGADEQANLDGNVVYISHTPTPAGTPAAGGEFDDMLVWIPVGLLYGRLTTAGVLP